MTLRKKSPLELAMGVMEARIEQQIELVKKETHKLDGMKTAYTALRDVKDLGETAKRNQKPKA